MRLAQKSSLALRSREKELRRKKGVSNSQPVPPATGKPIREIQS
jgi:hypothetical protein